MRRLLDFIPPPILYLTLRFVKWQSWERLNRRVAPQQFGAGSHHDFRWYSEGASIVPVKNVDEMCAWLAECEYVRDPDLFHERDYWQHPNTFEQLRKGDCEDRALWAWRKLTELGIPAEFYVGRWRAVPNGVPGFHAWVVCQLQGVDYLVEATAPTRETIMRPLSEVRDDYFPHFAIDAQFKARAFGGYMLYLKEERAKQKLKRRAPPA